MKNLFFFLIIFLLTTSKLFAQSVCEQFVNAIKNPTSFKKRTYRLSTQIKNDTHVNYTEGDTLGRIHFLGNVGSLQIESFYADGKRYSKIQSDFIKNDEWTYQEVSYSDTNNASWQASIKKSSENIDCQLIGEEKIKAKPCKILAFNIQKNALQRNGIDSFLMVLNVKAWFYPADSTVYKYAYEMTTERLAQTIISTMEFDVPVNINLPKNAKLEESQKIILVPNTNDSVIITEKKIAAPLPTPDSTESLDRSFVFVTVDQNPEYREGMNGLLNYIKNNMHFPEEARKAGISGTVNVSFIVEKDGTLSEIKIKRSVREDVDQEAIRVVKSMSGAWKAGKIKGKDVRSMFTLPLRFELGD